MRTCKSLGAALLSGLFFLTAFGQRQLHNAQHLEAIHSVLPQDQPYMLFSKGIYETGEDMWFNAWLFDRSLLTLSDRSRTLFLRIYDPADSLVWNEKYPIYGGRRDMSSLGNIGKTGNTGWKGILGPRSMQTVRKPCSLKRYGSLTESTDRPRRI